MFWSTKPFNQLLPYIFHPIIWFSTHLFDITCDRHIINILNMSSIIIELFIEYTLYKLITYLSQGYYKYYIIIIIIYY